MGFGSFFSGVCSAIGSAVSSVCSFISGSASTIGLTVGKLAAAVSPYIAAISAVVQVVGIICNLLKPHEKLEDKGEQVLQAAEQGITLESCDNDFEEYKKRIDEFEIDPEVKHSKEECQVAGASYVLKGIAESSPYLRDFASVLSLCIYDNTKYFFTPTRIKEYSELAKSMEVDISKVKAYFDGSLSTRDFDKVNDLIYTAEKNINPQFSEKEFDKTISDVTDEVRKM